MHKRKQFFLYKKNAYEKKLKGIPFSKLSSVSKNDNNSHINIYKDSDIVLDKLYDKILSAEERRLKKIHLQQNQAKIRSKYDRVKSKIIANKRRADHIADEKMRLMVAASDKQLNLMRIEINRRKRRIAFLALQKHLSKYKYKGKYKGKYKYTYTYTCTCTYTFKFTYTYTYKYILVHYASTRSFLPFLPFFSL
jgi:hypothetical protein